MISRFFFLIAFLFGTWLGSARAQTDQEVEARKTALDVAGAFTNDGFSCVTGTGRVRLNPVTMR